MVDNFVPIIATNDSKLKLEIWFLIRKLRAHAEIYSLNDELTMDTFVKLCCEIMKASDVRVREAISQLQADKSVIIDKGYVRSN